MTCHSSATCENLSQGFCCKCIQGRKLGNLWSLLDNVLNYLVGCAIQKRKLHTWLHLNNLRMVWRWKKLPSQRYSSKSHWQSWYVCKWYNHWKARITLLCPHPGWKNLYCYFQVWWIFSWNQFHEKFRGNDFTENHTDFQKVLVNFSVKSIPWKISQKFRENDFTESCRVPKSIGEELQSLTVIGTPIAWLFALPNDENPQSQNGFTITGGVFNYTAEIKFPEQNNVDDHYSAKITMQFQGLDAFDNLKASIEILGTIPKLRNSRNSRFQGSKIRLEDFSEIFTRIKPGTMMSQSKRTIGKFENHA